MTAATIVTLISAFIGSLGAYLVAARQFSGRIDQSEATDLWEESRSIRDWSAKRIAELEHRVDILESNNERLIQKNVGLMAELASANKRIVELEAGDV